MTLHNRGGDKICPELFSKSVCNFPKNYRLIERKNPLKMKSSLHFFNLLNDKYFKSNGQFLTWSDFLPPPPPQFTFPRLCNVLMPPIIMPPIFLWHHHNNIFWYHRKTWLQLFKCNDLNDFNCTVEELRVSAFEQCNYIFLTRYIWKVMAVFRCNVIILLWCHSKMGVLIVGGQYELKRYNGR